MPKRTSRKGPRDGASERGFRFDAAEADRRCAWFGKYLRHTKGEWAGGEFALDPWQRDRIIRPLFGWKRPDGLRRYRTVYVEVPKKNGKSTLCAGLGLMLLCADGEAGAEIYSAACDRDQARIVFDTARQMAQESPEIAARVKVYRSAIVYEKNHSVYRVISADAKTKQGFNAHGVIFDELHEQRSRDLWDTLTANVVGRRQPIVLAITNSGWDRKSICWEQHEYAEKVRDGIVPDDTFLPVLFNAPKEADPFDEGVWADVNPGLGSMVKVEALRAEAMKARESGAKLNTFRRLHLGQWTESAVRWIDLDRWKENGGAINEAELEGQYCYAGLDLSTTTDISAFVMVFPPQGESTDYRVLAKFWCPEDRIQDRARKDRVPYDVWAKAGWIEATEGSVVDYDVIRARINELGKRFEIREIPRDRWNAAQITTQLMGDGFTVVDFGQGYASMSDPSKQFDALYRDRKFRHGDNPVLTWMAANVMAEQDAAGNIKPSKGKSGDRIDGIVAAVMAVGRAHVDEGGSIYNERGLVAV